LYQSAVNKAGLWFQLDVKYWAVIVNFSNCKQIGFGCRGLDHGIPHLLQAVTLSATLVRFYFCFIINFSFLVLRIVLFVFFAFHLQPHTLQNGADFF
jgi:hypothetical protein